jgi:hypothetical protein
MKLSQVRIRACLIVAAITPLLFTSCDDNPETFAIHNPIFPRAAEQVTFTLNKITGTVDTVKLFVTVADVDSSGNLSNRTPEAVLQTWSSPAFPVTHTSSSGYGANKYVTYRFEVSGNSNTYNHVISFATNPYPVLFETPGSIFGRSSAEAPAPVYVVGDVDRVLNCVFIPDVDITWVGQITAQFYDAVSEDIDKAFHREECVRRYRHAYNFFVNQTWGQAGDYNAGTPHSYPSNHAQLSFAQARIILHTADKRDFSDGKYVGTEYYNRGTILHETGHLLYNLADEYQSGSHWRNAEMPNNWDSLAAAQSAASGRGKTSADAVRIGKDSWWKLCNGNCMMLNTGLNIFPYDQPCKDRILLTISRRSSGP